MPNAEPENLPPTQREEAPPVPSMEEGNEYKRQATSYRRQQIDALALALGAGAGGEALGGVGAVEEEEGNAPAEETRKHI